MKRISLRSVAIGFIAIACAIYLPKVLWPEAPFYLDVLSPKRLQLLGFVAKIACLAAAAAFSLRSATQFAKRDAARGPWMLLGSSFALWTLGHVLLMVYAFVLDRRPPLPSIADLPFLLGYVPLFVGLVRFISVYRGSGLPVGSARQHLRIAAGAALVLAVLSYVLLAPIVRSALRWPEIFVNLAYPVMDVVALVPTIVMIRIVIAFRPGSVWAVWAALLLGFVFLAMADAGTAYLWPSEAAATDPRLHLTYLLGYFSIACGARLQYELLAK
jgi:hypothetical protein